MDRTNDERPNRPAAAGDGPVHRVLTLQAIMEAEYRRGFSDAGLSRVLADPDREALDRLRAYVTPERRVSMPTRAPVRRADIAALVAVVERLAAAPAPEALVDAVAEWLRADATQNWADEVEAWDDLSRPGAAQARESWRRKARAVLAVVGQAATHDTDTARSRFEQFVEDITPRGMADRPIRMRPKTEDAASRAAATDSGEGR